MTHPATTPAAGGEEPKLHPSWHALAKVAIAADARMGVYMTGENVALLAASPVVGPMIRAARAYGLQVAGDTKPPAACLMDDAALSASSLAAGATGVLPAGWKLVPEEPTYGRDQMSWAGAMEMPAELYEFTGRAGHLACSIYRAMLAAAPEAPTPVTSAPGAEGEEDLAGLSARATPGPWSVSGARRRVEEESCVHINAPFCASLLILPTAAGKQALDALADAKFVVALERAYREGRSVAVAPDPSERVTLQDPLVEIAPDARKNKEPCGECRIRPGGTCDICGTKGPVDTQKLRQLCGMLDDLSAWDHSKNLIAAVKILEAAR